MNELLNRCNLNDLDYFASLIEPAIKGKRACALARELLFRYGTIENVFCADEKSLSAIAGKNASATVKLLAAVTSRRKTDLFSFGKKHTNAEIIDYFKALFIGDSVEKAYLMTFDAEERAVSCELVGVGTVNVSEIMPRKLLEVAYRDRAKSVVIAHNHPGGNTRPSPEDENLTAVMNSIFERAGIALLYHCIVAGQDCNIYTINDGKNKF